MGGLYSAGSLSSDLTAFASPIPPPDLTKCTITSVGEESVPCCPPFKLGQKVVDFKLPSSRERVRIRPAAHLVDKSYVKKYERAIQLMKALPEDDPRSFKQQANIHCAYCNGAYMQTGFPDTRFEVHSSWLFFPFHRFYLHFFERILGKLIDDPTFALPYWNWDNPPGMSIPSIFMNPNSPLHDPIRNPDHQESILLDMDWNDQVDSSSPEEQYKTNLSLMHTQMVSGASKPSLFFGSSLKAGDNVTEMSQQGTIESTPHGIVHVWMAFQEKQDTDYLIRFIRGLNSEYDVVKTQLLMMKPLPSVASAYDDILQHEEKLKGGVNIDDHVSTSTPPNPSGAPNSDSSLSGSSCHLQDVLTGDEEEMEVEAAEDNQCIPLQPPSLTTVCLMSIEDIHSVPIPWLKTTTTPKATRKAVASSFGAEKSANAALPKKKKRELTPMSAFPLVLNKSISVKVVRPKMSRNHAEKNEEEEVVVVEGIELDLGKLVKFDIAINDEDNGVPAGPQDTEFAGTFVNVPHKKKIGGASMCKTSMKIGITSLLDDLDVDGDDTLIVTLTPKIGEVKIGGMKIDYITE
ncbi:Polyphenol oxidase, chloroplastic [Linum perenne]